MLLDTMTAPSAADLRVAVTAFEHAFEERGAADLEDFLPLPLDPDYAAVLGELVRADMRLHWTFGRRRYVDDYVRRFPVELAALDQLAALAQEEYQARLAAGDDVQPDQYQSRYGVGVDGWLPPSLGPTTTPMSDDLICLPRERTRTIAVPCARPAPARKLSTVGQMPKAGQRFLHFDLVKELGRGVFGRVFLARQTDLAERPVALKVTPETDTEPQLLARLQHTNIVPIHAVYQAGPLQAICMPYFGSVTLARVIADLGRSPGQLPQTGRGLLSTLFETRVDGLAQTRADEDSPTAPPPEEPPALTALARMSQVGAALWIAARLADGLAHAHERGILHCDLKPANVLVSDDGQPMLLDFNVSADRAALTKRKTLRLGGTLPYMAPEYLNLIHNDTGELTPRADLFSLGVVLYELLTGTDPYPSVGDDARDPVGSYLSAHGRLPEPPGRRNPAVTPAVDAIVLKLLEPDPAKRYAEAGHVREDLERQLADRPLKFAKEESIRERARKWRRRNPRLTVGMAVALAALGFFILPATAFAIRSEQLAARRHEVARAEAILAQQKAVRELKTAQVLLSSRTLDPLLINEGFERGQAVLDEYGVETDERWAEKSAVTLLSADQQVGLRQELGGTLLMFARVELARKPGDEDAAALALKWNQLAEQCYPADARPKFLAAQRAALLRLLPEQAATLPEPAAAIPVDAYYDGLDGLAAGKPNEALIKLVPFTDAHPDHFMAWYLRGVCHEAIGQFADSAAAFTVCTTLWPEFAWPHFSRGIARLRQGRPAEAEADFTRALERRPNWADALLNRALARQNRNDLKGAEADLTAALAEANCLTRVYFLRSRVRLAAGDKAGADADAAEGKKVEPRDETSWITRAFWRLPTDPKGAVADYDAALAKNPRSPDALRSKAAVLADNLHQPKEAVAALDKLLEMYPTYTEARAGRAVYLARTGDAKRATDDLTKVLAEEPTPFRLFQMAGVYAQLAKGDATGANKQKALQLMAKAFRTGFEQYDKVAKDPDLAPVRDDPDFKALVEHAKKLRVK
jgi:serine/threonine protein kinase/lipoprotein NlpI